MEKYGFIYIWFDCKNKRYYIGSHWGTEHDSYKCSSTWARNSMDRRPNDFKRRILKRIYTSRKDLYEEETRWLQMIKPEEVKVRYYNLRRDANHWSASEYDRLAINEKISVKTKEAMARSDIKDNYEASLKNRDTRSSDPNVRAKRSASMQGKNKGNWNTAQKISAEMRRGIPLSKEHRANIAAAGIFSSLNKKKIECKYCGFIGNPGNIGRYHNDKCKSK
jgi:hypothetical protein